MDDTRGVGAGAAPSLASQYRYLLRALHDVRLRQLHGAQSTLNYTLDPGEGGVLRAAAPAQAAAALGAQERGNVRQLSREAQARGEDVVSIAVSYEAGVVDGRLALRAGRSEVVSLPREQRDAVTAVYEANREAARSLRLLEQDNDAGWRSLSGGLSAGDAAPPQAGLP